MEQVHLETDILVIGGGGAGMFAAIAAAEEGCRVTLADRSLIGRGGATVMAQMTVAVAVGEEEPDHWRHHLADTLAAGRGICDARLARLLCEEGPARIRQMDDWKVGWAREDGHIKQIHAPGHDRPRCVYVDFLNTGPAVSKTLRTVLNSQDAVQRLGELCITDIVVSDGAAVGAVAIHLPSRRIVTLAAKAVIVATGGLTRLYQRNSASANMAGDGYALALRAGAELMDMEFVQFFPIGHLAPRMIGMDPIMWDPFRYKLGGRLLNGAMEEFTEQYGQAESGAYVITRDLATYAITKEVEAGRGSPAGGVYLSFTHIPESDLRAAFGPVIDRLAANGIDLTKTPIEVAPIAHYHMGGIRVDPAMATGVPGLYAAGEVVGGANGANRLSGNAITEALVFGERAGREAAMRVRAGAGASSAAGSSASNWNDRAAAPALDLIRAARPPEGELNMAAAIVELQRIMGDLVGPFRTQQGLSDALDHIDTARRALGDTPFAAGGPFDVTELDWFDLRNMYLVAECIARTALLRTESRGAHQREDHPEMQSDWQLNQIVSLGNGALRISPAPVMQEAA